MADEVLRQGVQGITALITESAVINLDFADVKTVMSDRGVAHMGVGVGRGENRVADAVKAAIGSPLLETSIDGAKAVLLNITGGYDLGMLEATEAAELIETAAAREANIIFGASIKEEIQDEIRITVIATGFEDEQEPSFISVNQPIHQPQESSRSEVKVDSQASKQTSEDENEQQATVEEKPKKPETEMEVPIFLTNAAKTPRKIF